MKLRAISLFSNCGAGDLGYGRAGFKFTVLAEIDRRRLEVAALNHPGAVTVLGDLRDTWPAVVRRYREEAGIARPDLLAACPPCQGMSSVRAARGRAADPDAGSRDGRNLLVVPIAEVALELGPRVIVVENVPAFFSRQVRDPFTGLGITAAKLLARLLAAEYECFPFLADLVDYGVPQTRKRVFLTFVRRDDQGLTVLERAHGAPYPRPTHTSRPRRRQLLLRHVLERLNLSSLDAASEKRAHGAHAMHVVPVWKDHRYTWVEAIASGSGRSAWSNDVCARCGRVEVGERAATCPNCCDPLPRPVVKARNGRWRLIHGFESSSYRRMAPNRPAATITTASGHLGSSRTVHPFENRVLSPLECALLQTFPRSFQWGRAFDSYGHTFVREMIGEAVPPRFTELHGRTLLALLVGGSGRWLVSTDDPRCRRGCSNFELGYSIPAEEVSRRERSNAASSRTPKLSGRQSVVALRR